MSKRKPRNAFYFFMIKFKEEKKEIGVNFATLSEVADAAGPVWKSMTSEERKPFEDQAKKDKEQIKKPENIFTSFGRSLAQVDASEYDKSRALEAERADVFKLVKNKSISTEGILDEDFYVMDVNSYCYARGTYVIGEFTLLRFSLKHGVKDFFHKIINPGVRGIPFAYEYEAKMGSKEHGLPRIEDHPHECTDYIQVLASMVDYLKHRDRQSKFSRIYTIPDKVDQVSNFIHQLCKHAAEDEAAFRVYRLDWLLFQLWKHVPAQFEPEVYFPKEASALTWLTRGRFIYGPGMSCKMHYDADRTLECSKTRALRWVYSLLHVTCQMLGVVPELDRHVPDDTRHDMEEASSVVAATGGYADATLPESAASHYDEMKPSRAMSTCSDPGSVPAGLRPQLGPSLLAIIGRGRGRALAERFKHMKI